MVADADNPMFAAIDGRATPISPRECVFRTAGDGAIHVLPIGALEALDACRAFATLDDHARRVVERNPQLAVAGVRHGLEQMAGRGLLVRDADFLAERRELAPASLRAVFVRACDRPAQLGRLLESLAANERAHRAGHRYVVLDDSREPEAARAHAALVSQFSELSGARALHVGAERWADAVARIGAPAPAAAALACARGGPASPRFGGGKGYNLALLLGAGARFAMLDDDFVLPLKRMPGAIGGMALAASPDSPARFHDDAEVALAEGEPIAGDPFVAGLAFCGTSLGDVWSREPARLRPADLAGFAPSAAPHVRGGARVATLTHGHRGDSGAQSNAWLYALDDASRRDLTRTPLRYARTLERAAVWYGPSRMRVDAHGAFTPFLVDATALTPPTMPHGRSEDLLFGALIAACSPDSVALHSDATIGHLQAARKRVPGNPITTPAANQWLAELMLGAAADVRADSPAARMRALSSVLHDCASASRSGRLELIETYLLFASADLSSRLVAARESAADAPDDWKRDVDHLIDGHRKRLAGDLPARFDDWPADADPAETLRMTVTTLAEMLDAWPALFEHATETAERLLQD